MRRIVASGIRQAEQAQTALIYDRLGPEVLGRMLALIERTAEPGEEIP